MSDDAQREFREVQAFFRLPSVGLVEKDVHVVRAIQAVASVDADPFTVVFGGGTALSRAHKVVRRMSEDVDFKIVRHIYDLHLMRGLIDLDAVAGMAGEIAASDAAEFRNQYPAYHDDVAGETWKALNALRTEPVYRERYTGFVSAMVYGEQATFDDAMNTVAAVARRWMPEIKA